MSPVGYQARLWAMGFLLILTNISIQHQYWSDYWNIHNNVCLLLPYARATIIQRYIPGLSIKKDGWIGIVKVLENDGWTGIVRVLPLILQSSMWSTKTLVLELIHLKSEMEGILTF